MVRVVDLPEGLNDPLTAVIAAVRHAEQKYGKLTRDPMRAGHILNSEVGEVSDALLDLTRPAPVDPHEVAIHKRHLYSELAQVAATALLMMENLQP